MPDPTSPRPTDQTDQTSHHPTDPDQTSPDQSDGGEGDAVVVVAHVRPREEARDEVRALLLETAAAVHPEDGCELYAMHEASDAFVVVERWSSRAALEAHGAGAPLARLAEGLQGRTTGELEVTVATSLPAGDPGKGVVRGA